MHPPLCFFRADAVLDMVLHLNLASIRADAFVHST